VNLCVGKNPRLLSLPLLLPLLWLLRNFLGVQRRAQRRKIWLVSVPRYAERRLLALINQVASALCLPLKWGRLFPPDPTGNLGKPLLHTNALVPKK
jgi:hypothetical protein